MGENASRQEGISCTGWIIIALNVLFVILLFAFCAIPSDSSSSSANTHGTTYTCGYCGKQMKGGYYDYFDNKYACYDCSKKYREH